jgi:hypothetical protein
MTAYSENNTKRKNTLRGQDIEFLNVKAGGAYTRIKHCTLRGGGHAVA